MSDNKYQKGKIYVITDVAYQLFLDAEKWIEWELHKTCYAQA